jgi:hypothetical protein
MIVAYGRGPGESASRRRFLIFRLQDSNAPTTGASDRSFFFLCHGGCSGRPSCEERTAVIDRIGHANAARQPGPTM